MENNIEIDAVTFGHSVRIKGLPHTSLNTHQREFEGVKMSFGKGLLKIEWKNEVNYVPYGNIASMRAAKD